MNKKIIYFIVIFSAILIQTSFLPIISGESMFGDAVLTLVLVLAVVEGFAASLHLAIIAGILYDFASYAIFGEHALIFLLVVYGVSFFSRRLSVEVKGTGVLLFFVFTVSATLISIFLSAFFLSIGTKSGNFLHAFGSLQSMIFQAAVNAALFFLWYGLIKKIKKYSHEKE